VGAIEVEASPLLEDNQWVLDVAAKDKIMVGTVGDLEPGKPDFRKHLERFHRNPLYRGIRCGNLWDRNIHDDLPKAEFIADVKALADSGLEMDIANPTPVLINDLIRLTDKVPTLRVVIDHLLRIDLPEDKAVLGAYHKDLRELGKRPLIYVKGSGVLRRVDGRIPEDLNFYKPRLDELWEIFGQDRLVYGSDWPNSDLWLPYPHQLKIVMEYFTGKGQAAAEKFFWKNSIAAYRWVKRDANQPS
jgi:predicted TIM-barrel fold metal-dependent hydrolase